MSVQKRQQDQSGDMRNEDLNLKHANDPQVGDYWNEMFAPCYLIIDRSRFSVSFLDKQTKSDNGWTWDVANVKTMTIKEFSKMVRYTSEAMNNKTWCDVTPNWKHAEAFIKAAFEVDEEDGRVQVEEATS
jgi:hypothetical protein